MDVYIYKMNFKAPAHFGDTGIDLENVQETIHSDSFFSALMNVMNIYYGEKATTEFIIQFKNSQFFLISSLFVYNDGKYFLPRPLDDSGIDDAIQKKKGKELKKLKWLDAENFKKWFSGINLTERDIDNMVEAQTDYNKAFKREIRPRVTLDRTNQQSALYHCGYIHFSKNSGLYGLVAFKDCKAENLFNKLIELLGDTGLGGERTYGCGTFEVKFEKAEGVFKDILLAPSDKYTLLSLFHPSPDEQSEFKTKLIAYDIIRRRGWITSGRDALSLKRNSVGFVTEGSVFNDTPSGSLVDVTPDEDKLPFQLNHRIYRYGYAFTVPLVSKEPA